MDVANDGGDGDGGGTPSGPLRGIRVLDLS